MGLGERKLLKKTVSEIMLTLLLISTLILAFNIRLAKAETEILLETEPSTEFIDFHNGTRLMIVDYGNGTRDVITETFMRNTAKLLLQEDDRNHSLLATLPTSLEESTEYINTTQTLATEQEVLLGFTYNIAYLRKEWNATGGWWIFRWEFKAGIVIDVRCGLRLPVNITLEYPEQMTWGDNYTIYATLNPIDKPSYDEFLFTFKANVWAEARIAGLPVPLTYVYGPNIDMSKSFQTPLGLNAEAPLPSVDIDLFELIKELNANLTSYIDLIALVFKPYLVLQPTFGSQKITAKATALGDASVVQGANLTWSTPNQILNFTVNANDYNDNNSTDNAKIKLSEFKYYFTQFYLNFKLRLDLNSLINALGIGDLEVTIFTIDLSWLVEGLYLGTHPGYSGYVYATIIVNRRVGPPERIEPRDISLLEAAANPRAVYAGQIVNITVTAKNLGNVTESFNVTVLYNTTTIGIEPNIQLAPNENTTLTFSWNTTGLPECHMYIIRAEASTVPNEIDMDDNILVIGAVKIKRLGDINGDNQIDICDVVSIASIYGCREGEPNWNPFADIAPPYGKIDIFDLVTCTYHYGERYP